MSSLSRGQFVTVGPFPGVIVAIFGDPDVPEEHVAIWYREKDAQGVPRVRTVPEEYAEPLAKMPIYYH